MKRVLVVGGANGIGLSIAKVLTAKDEIEKVYIVDKAELASEYQEDKIESYQFDLTSEDYSIFDRFNDTVIRVIKHFYDKMLQNEGFYCGVMVSIAGFMSSPFFSLYGASKAALKIFIESVNVELEKAGTSNRILNVSPGSIKGTSLNQGKTDLSITKSLAEQIIAHVENKDDLFIPQYEEVFKHVLARYHEDFRKEGLHSYEYKLNSGRVAK